MDNHPARGTRAPAWLWAVFVAVLLAITPTAASAQIRYHATAGPEQSQGAVLILHPGGWIYTGKLFADLMMRDWGGQFDDRYTTWSSTYSPGAQSVADTLDAYDALRAQVGPDTPICAMGASAGGHLALMLAALRDPACVVAIAAPTDMTTMQASPPLSAMAQAAFGYDTAFMAANSPALITDKMRAPVLLVHEDGDQVVPVTQSREFAANYANATFVTLPFGDEESISHSTTTHAAAAAFKTEMRAFVDQAIAARLPPAEAPAPPVVETPTPPVTQPTAKHKAKQHRHTAKKTRKRTSKSSA
jgi:dienelactone hydrolase